MDKTRSRTDLLDMRMLGAAVVASIQKLNARVQLRNPVMFAVYLGSMLTTVLWLKSLWDTTGESSGFIFCVAVWLWFTVLFANFAEAIAEGHGKAQAASLRKTRTSVMAQKLISREARTAGARATWGRRRGG